MLARCRQAMRRAPLRTNLCIAVPLMVVGDSCAQLLESRNGKREESLDSGFDLQRSAMMAAYSGLVFTPIFFNVYKVADRLFHGSHLLVAMQKAVFAGIVGGVPSNTLFLALGTTLEIKVFGKAPAQDATVSEAVVTRLRNKFPELMQASLLFWLPMDCGNFYVASPMYRILVTTLAAVVWNCYLSLLSYKNDRPALRPPSCGAKLEDEVVDALRRCMERNPRKENENDQKIRDCIGEVVDLLDSTTLSRDKTAPAADKLKDAVDSSKVVASPGVGQ